MLFIDATHVKVGRGRVKVTDRPAYVVPGVGIYGGWDIVGRWAGQEQVVMELCPVDVVFRRVPYELMSVACGSTPPDTGALAIAQQCNFSPGRSRYERKAAREAG